MATSATLRTGWLTTFTKKPVTAVRRCPVALLFMQPCQLRALLLTAYAGTCKWHRQKERGCRHSRPSAHLCESPFQGEQAGGWGEAWFTGQGAEKKGTIGTHLTSLGHEGSSKEQRGSGITFMETICEGDRLTCPIGPGTISKQAEC
jgi:hypothetical protein